MFDRVQGAELSCASQRNWAALGSSVRRLLAEVGAALPGLFFPQAHFPLTHHSLVFDRSP
jgi:hypothetical protein